MVKIVNVNTKKELKEQINAGNRIYIQDPAIINPISLFSDELQVGESATVTNHPKRSYFATIKRIKQGLKVI